MKQQACSSSTLQMRPVGVQADAVRGALTPMGPALPAQRAVTNFTALRRRPRTQTHAPPGQWPCQALQTCSPSLPTRSPGLSLPPAPRPPAVQRGGWGGLVGAGAEWGGTAAGMNFMQQ